MNLFYFSTHRQAGKTTLGLYEAYKESAHLFVTVSPRYQTHIIRGVTAVSSRTFETNSASLVGVKSLILDEYHQFSLKAKKRIYELVRFHRNYLENVFVFSTPTVQFDIAVYNFIAEVKKDYFEPNSEVLALARKRFPEWFQLPIPNNVLIDVLSDLWFDIITFPDSFFTIKKICNGSQLTFLNTRVRDDFNPEYHKETEITGQYLISNKDIKKEDQ